MAVISFFFVLCRDGTGRGCHGVPPPAPQQFCSPGEYCHGYFFFVYEMKISVRRSFTARILP